MCIPPRFIPSESSALGPLLKSVSSSPLAGPAAHHLSCNDIDRDLMPDVSIVKRHDFLRRSLSQPPDFYVSNLSPSLFNNAQSAAANQNFDSSPIRHRDMTNGVRKVTFPGDSPRLFATSGTLKDFTDIDQVELSPL